MRTALRRNPARERVSTSKSLPPPIEGWDAVSPLAAMAPARALQLDNWVARPGYCELRRGNQVHAIVGSSPTTPVESLMAYHGVTVEKLFAAAATKIYDVTTAGGATEAVSGLTNARRQHINFATSGGNFLWTCNGVDTPRFYDGASWATVAISGISADNIIQVAAFKNRLWFARVGSIDAAFLPVDSIQGAASVFPLGGVFTKGGVLMAIGTWAVEGGNGPANRIAFISSRGQIAIYTGTNPGGGGDFAEVGVFDAGPPLGRRCLTKVGPDLAIITMDGVLPLSRAIVTERGAAQTVALTQRIQPIVAQSARDWGNNFGWQLTSYPRGSLAILNVPDAENSSQRQYVMDTVGGGWSRFFGWNANCFETFRDKLYFGANDGTVREADRSGCDVGQTLVADLRTAFNYLGARGQLKQMKMCRGIFTTDGQIKPNFAVNMDFRDDAVLVPVSASAIGAQSLWDQALWDQALWSSEQSVISPWVAARGLGYCASLRLQVSIPPALVGGGLWDEGLWDNFLWDQQPTEPPPVKLLVNAFDVLFEGGNLM